MNDVGNECPECGRRLVGARCACGWRVGFQEGTGSSTTCDVCRGPVRATQLTPGEDGKARCAACHVGYLQDRAARSPGTPEEVAACREAIARGAAKWQSVRT